MQKMKFYYCTGLKTVTMGSRVDSIAEEAFQKCNNLDSIKCDAVEPPLLDNSVFSDVNTQTCSLVVPEASIEAYKAAEQWKDFLNTIAGLDEISIADSSITVENGTIVNSCNVPIDVYNISGMKMYSGNDATVALDHGIYIVVIGNKTVKVLL